MPQAILWSMCEYCSRSCRHRMAAWLDVAATVLCSPWENGRQLRVCCNSSPGTSRNEQNFYEYNQRLSNPMVGRVSCRRSRSKIQAEALMSRARRARELASVRKFRELGLASIFGCLDLAPTASYIGKRTRADLAYHMVVTAMSASRPGLCGGFSQCHGITVWLIDASVVLVDSDAVLRRR